MAISRTARNGVVVIVVCFPYPKLHANSVAWLAEPAVGGCGVRVGRCCGYCGRSVPWADRRASVTHNDRTANNRQM